MLSIIVPIKNQEKIVRMCLDSLFRHYSNEEIILIDDGSTEQNLISYLEELQASKKIILLTNKTSVGHSGACTKGIELSSNEIVFLLNSDTIVTKNSLNILAKVLEQNKEIAVTGPSTSSASGPQLLPGLYDKRFSMTIDEIEEKAIELEENKQIIDLELVNGFCFAIKKAVFMQVGGFDPALQSYGNEKELLIRIRKLGLRTVWVKGSYVHHFGKMSYSKESINVGVAQRDSDRYILRKHGRLS
jgi:GT2 family glycosyltransferase